MDGRWSARRKRAAPPGTPPHTAMYTLGKSHPSPIGRNVSPDPQKPNLQELLRRFASTIGNGPLGTVDHAPESWAEPMHSIKNVLQKLKRDGGRALPGWVFLDRESLNYGPYLIASHHAIWSPEGSAVGVDITPFAADPKYRPYSPGGKTLFLLDETAQPKMIGRTTAPLPSRFFAATEDPSLVAYVQDLNNEEQIHFQKLCEGALEAQRSSQREQ